MPEEPTSESVVRKVSRRLIPFLYSLYVFAYLDRLNIGFAALSMNPDACGIFASATSPLLVGRLRDRTGSFTASSFFVAPVLVAAAALVLAARGGQHASSARVS